jgi:hypothetical protein
LNAGGAATILTKGGSFNGAGIGVDATSVYWVNVDAVSESVRSMPLAGGPPAVLADHVQPGGLAIGATNVYWTTSNGYDQGNIVAVAKNCEDGVCKCPGSQVPRFDACAD